MIGDQTGPSINIIWVIDAKQQFIENYYVRLEKYNIIPTPYGLLIPELTTEMNEANFSCIEREGPYVNRMTQTGILFVL